MGDKTAIEWCDATFNPWWGCTRISPACDHCYADTWAKRTGHALWDNGERRTFGDKHWNEPLKWARAGFYECRECDWRGETKSNCPQCAAEVRSSRRRVFCASMADVFDKDAPEGARERLWALIEATPELDWLLLTKRVGNVYRFVPMWVDRGWPANVWLGSTIANQEEADRDIPKLLAIPATVRFLSCEPLLGPVDLTGEYLADRCSGRYPFPNLPREDRTTRLELLDWVISGGESGPKARPSHPDWHRSLRDQCVAAGVPFLFKQWGEWTDYYHAGSSGWELTRSDDDLTSFGRLLDGPLGGKIVQTRYPWNDRTYPCMVRVGKKDAGRKLDGRTHDGFPHA